MNCPNCMEVVPHKTSHWHDDLGCWRCRADPSWPVDLCFGLPMFNEHTSRKLYKPEPATLAVKYAHHDPRTDRIKTIVIPCCEDCYLGVVERLNDDDLPVTGYHV